MKSVFYYLSKCVLFTKIVMRVIFQSYVDSTLFLLKKFKAPEVKTFFQYEDLPVLKDGQIW